MAATLIPDGLWSIIEPGTPSSDSFAAARAPKPSPAVAILRPTGLGLALQGLVQLPLRPTHCETRDRHRLAPPRLSAVLEMEEQGSSWSTVGADGSLKRTSALCWRLPPRT